jgi:ArsR family transcriptional regulator
MGHPVRLLILEALAEHSQCVKDLNTLVPVSQPHLSQHMTMLRKADLVDCHVNGPLRCYYLLRPKLVRTLLRDLAKDEPVRHRDRESVLREVRRTGRNK